MKEFAPEEKLKRNMDWLRRHPVCNKRQIVNVDRIYRNEPCPCGSGLKWKKCCRKP